MISALILAASALIVSAFLKGMKDATKISGTTQGHGGGDGRPFDTRDSRERR